MCNLCVPCRPSGPVLDAMREDEWDCIANMYFIDQAYQAAGLPIRQPSGGTATEAVKAQSVTPRTK